MLCLVPSPLYQGDALQDAGPVDVGVTMRICPGRARMVPAMFAHPPLVCWGYWLPPGPEYQLVGPCRCSLHLDRSCMPLH